MTDIVDETDENVNTSIKKPSESAEDTNTKNKKDDITEVEIEDNAGDEGKLDDSGPTNGYQNSPPEKRQRKKVQRLSETWNRAHEAKEEERAKAAKEVSAALEAGKGTALGDIPLIDATIRKTKPVELKVLHLIIYGRAGAVTEVRSNIRKFRGFGFNEGSEQYTKKCAAINQRSATELREILRILNLEVSGTREQLASRVIEFLSKPSANVVKFKGKVKKSRSRSRSKKKDSSKGVKRKSTKGTPSLKTTSSEASVEEISHPDEDSDLEKSSESSLSGSKDNDSDISFDSSKKKKKPAKKRGAPSRAPAKPVAKRSRKVVLDDSENEEPPPKEDATKDEQVPDKSVDSEDEDTPLSTFTSKKLPPSDDELKTSIIDLLKTVNLEETSLKVVREKIFSQYPDIDLSGKKEFINTTVKEFLSQS